MGSNSSIQDASVQYILDSVMYSLAENPDRKFIYVESAFFWRWWNEQTDSKKQQVRDFVKNGQLEFINGGWCMNDEATTYFESMIDQMTLGHRLLRQEFGITPKVAWHIDPFGHSANQASLYSRMGFDGFIFTRIDYQDKQNRISEKNLEFVWRPSSTLGSESDIFCHVTSGHYSPPDNFNFERGDDPIQDDPNLYDMNVEAKCDQFINEMYETAEFYRTNELLVLWGDDFQYSNANLNFKNIDKMIKYINNHYDKYGANVFYSTPSIFLEAVNSYDLDWSVKYDDFFPYADGDHSYWTGYYTSRPGLKGYERQMNSLLHASERLYTLASAGAKNPAYLDNIEEFGRAIALAQHHDAVAGTEKQHVANDYAKRMSIGQTDTIGSMTQILSAQLSGSSSQVSLSYCPLLNESICPSTDLLNSLDEILPVVIYNSLAWDNYEWVYLPVPISNLAVFDADGKSVASQLNVEMSGSVYKYTLIFQAVLPPLGYSTYYVQSVSSSNSVARATVVKETPTETLDTVSIQNDEYIVYFDGETGLQSGVKAIETQQYFNVTHNYNWYFSNPGDTSSSQKSGAYIFRPVSSTVYPFGSGVSLTVFSGPLVQEVKQTWLNSATPLTRRVRLYQSPSQMRHFIEIVNQIGPIDTSDKQGKEIISNYASPLDTNSLFYTDSNGQEMMQRNRDYRETWDLSCAEPVSCNYYPINAAAYIEDVDQNIRLTWLTDRSCGGSSMSDGSFEIMHHRAMLFDDGRGVGEPLNEQNQIITKNYMILTNLSQEGEQRRHLTTKLNNPSVIFFGKVGNSSDIQSAWAKLDSSFKPMTSALPSNLNIHIKTWGDDVNPKSGDLVQIRLFHLYAAGESDTFSVPVTVDLNALFVDYEFTGVVELTLSANQAIDSVDKLTWKTTEYQQGSDSSHPRPPVSNPVLSSQRSSVSVTLNPMEIRTFSATLV